MSFSVQLTPDMVPLDPGTTTPVGVVVVNRGGEADRFELEIEGIDPEWKAVPVPVFGVEAGETHSEKVFLKPPRASESLAGNYPFVIRIRSLISGEQKTVQGVAQVKPFHHLSMEIDPKKGSISPFRRQNIFDITLVNLGNTEHTLQFLASDPEDACAYEFDSEQITIGPGQQREVELEANPTKSPIFSSGRLIGFTVTGRSIDTPSVVANAQAQLEQRPLLTPTSLAVFVLAILMIGVWIMAMPKPATLSLSVNPMSITAGQTVTVHWEAEHAKTIVIRSDGGPIYEGSDPKGDRTITLNAAGTVTINAEATGGGHTVRQSRQVTVAALPEVPAPKILSLSAEPKRVKLGQPFIMKFELSDNVVEAILQPTDEHIDPALKEKEITPTQTGIHQYELLAKNSKGEVVRKSFKVEVYDESEAQILGFTADPKLVRLAEGNRVTISWQVNEKAQRVELKSGSNDPIQVLNSGSTSFTIAAKTVFVLTAIDSSNRKVSQQIVVNVEAAPVPPPATDSGGTDAGSTTGGSGTNGDPTTGGGENTTGTMGPR